MTTRQSTRDTIANALRSTGFTGRGSVWRRRGSGVQWVVHIDQLPYGNRLGIDVGIGLQTDATPRLPTDCPIMLGLENLHLIDGSLVLQALDVDSSLADGDRQDVLEGAVTTLGEYIAERLSFAAIQDAYRAGDFNSAFVHKDARAVLESEDDS